MKTNNRPTNRLMNEINVVPYIDVMLVLLVIFMVTAPLEVIIKKNTALALRDHAKGSKQMDVSRDELIRILKARKGEQAKQAVVISADRNVRYEEVIGVMDLLQQQNIQKVGLLTKLKAE